MLPAVRPAFPPIRESISDRSSSSDHARWLVSAFPIISGESRVSLIVLGGWNRLWSDSDGFTYHIYLYHVYLVFMLSHDETPASDGVFDHRLSGRCACVISLSGSCETCGL